MALILAATAVGLAVLAFRARKSDQGIGRVLPVLGLTCGLVNLLCGASQILIGVGALSFRGGTPWTWRSESDGFEVTIPTEHWTAMPRADVVAAFKCPSPIVIASIARVWEAGTDEEYNRALLYAKKIRTEAPTSETVERSGTNENGYPYWLYMGNAQANSQQFFMGVSITRVRDRAVLLMFEGHYRMFSNWGLGQEGEAFRTQAELFLCSVNRAKLDK